MKKSVKQTMRISIVLENVVLPKLGINRQMPRAVVYNPLDLGGIGYPSIHTIQDQKGTGHLVKHLKWGNDVGKDFQILLSAVQLHSGLTHPSLDETTLRITYL